MLGFSYDWSRELATTDVDYFRWTQWIFLVLFDTWFDPQTGKGRPIAELAIPPDVAAAGDEAVRRDQDAHRLAYQSHAPVNWCPALGTVLSNEEVIGGLSERGNHPVVRIPLRQWMLRITAYADRLESDLDGLDWPDSIEACSAIGSAAAPAPKSTFSSAPRRRPTASRIPRSSRLGATSAPPRVFRRRPATTCSASSPRGPTRYLAPRTWSSLPSIPWSGA